MKKPLALLLSMILTAGSALILTGCGSTEETGEPELIRNPITLTMEIQVGVEAAAEAGFQDMKETAFAAEENTSLQEAVQLFCLAHDISVTVNPSRDSLTELMGLSKKDFGDATGWIFKVNGQVPTRSPKDIIVVENDKITLEFVDFNTYSW